MARNEETKIKKLTPHLLLNVFELMSDKKDKFRFIKDIKTWAYFDGRVWILDYADEILSECLFDLAYNQELDNYGNIECGYYDDLFCYI